MSTFESKVSGIPCQIEVTHFEYQGPSTRPACLCDSPDEFEGHLECEFNVLDRKSYPAPWLESKLTSDDIDRINHEALHIWKSREYY